MNIPSQHTLNILIIVDNLDMIGGTTRIASQLANGMFQRGHRVTLLSSAKTQYRAFPLDDGVSVMYYERSDENIKIQALRKDLQKKDFDVCMAFGCGGEHLFNSVLLLGSGIPHIYSERVAPDFAEACWSRAGRLAAMSGADIIHLLLPEFKPSVPDFLQERVRVIPNPLREMKGEPSIQEKEKRVPKVLLWLGRLDDDVKRCSLALEAFTLLAEQFPQWNMHIVGDGKDRLKLQLTHMRSGLGERVRFFDETADVLTHYDSAHLFCITSFSEGFVGVVVEALSRGVPVVGFAQCSGVNSFVRHGENGLLGADMTPESLARELAVLMGNAQLRTEMGQKARCICDDLAPEKILNQWEAVFYEAAAKKGSTIADGFAKEPFASMARLSAVARREYIYRDFGAPMPGSFTYRVDWLRYRLTRVLPRYCALRLRYFAFLLQIYSRKLLDQVSLLWGNKRKRNNS